MICYMFQESNSFETTQPEDKFSDTSEEITASDSGKGGSEDDLPTHAHGKAVGLNLDYPQAIVCLRCIDADRRSIPATTLS